MKTEEGRRLAKKNNELVSLMRKQAYTVPKMTGTRVEAGSRPEDGVIRPAGSLARGSDLVARDRRTAGGYPGRGATSANAVVTVSSTALKIRRRNTRTRGKENLIRNTKTARKGEWRRCVKTHPQGQTCQQAASRRMKPTVTLNDNSRSRF